VVAASAGGGWLAERAGVPSGYMFAAMLAGLAYALVAPGRVSMPGAGFRIGQAITGVALGSFLRSATITGLGSRWLPVLLVSLATLAATIVAGLVLARVTRLDRPTASLGMVAGGASGIVGMADELGGDDRLVAFMQYLRVLVITLITPLLAVAVFGLHGHGAGAESGPALGTPGGWALTAGAGLAGVLVGPRLRLPAPALLGALVVAAAASLTGVSAGVQVPPVLRETGFGLIGLRIGLGFERETLRQLARVMLPVAASIAGLLVICFGFGWVLKLTANVSLLDGYLATTPGGMYAVLPIAYGSGANTTFVLAVQALRLVAMMLAAPAIVRWLIRSEEVGFGGRDALGRGGAPGHALGREPAGRAGPAEVTLWRRRSASAGPGAAASRRASGNSRSVGRSRAGSDRQPGAG
jgi:membrane AbrB-like protein